MSLLISPPVPGSGGKSGEGSVSGRKVCIAEKPGLWGGEC